MKGSYNMNKKILSLSITLVIAVSLLSSINVNAGGYDPKTIYGTLYINTDQDSTYTIAPSGINITVQVQDYTNTKQTNTIPGEQENYLINIEAGHTDQTCNFTIEYNEITYTPNDNQSIILSEENENGPAPGYYIIDLHVTITEEDTEPPSKITGLSVTDAKDGKLNLEWDAATETDFDHYNIYWNQDGYTNPIDTETTTSYQDTGLTNGQNYCYKISAVDTNNNEGEKSDQNCATPTETTTPNNPPDTPINPKPENNSENIGINPELSVFVTDPNGDNMNVSFYNENDELIGVVNNAQNATNASLYWGDLEYNTSYSWYAVANDSEFETRSDNFTFKTINQEEDNIKPNIFFEKPENGSLYIFDSMIFSAILKTPFVLGKLNIAINATDNETGISRVELSIIGNYQNITENLTQYPYTYEWNKIGFGLYNITATAYDMNQNSATTNIIVRKFL